MSFWALGEVRLLAEAVRQAPSVHTVQPWVMEPHERSVMLFERWDRTVPRHDPLSRDRLISCGAALTNLELAMRQLGWETVTALFPDPAHPDLVATVTAVRPGALAGTERDLFLAIPRRHSQRLAVNGQPLSTAELHAIEHALVGERTSFHRVTGYDEAGVVAAVSEHAARVLRHDHRYQRELRALTVERGRSAVGARLFGGLARSGDARPDHDVLTSLIADESVFIVETADDSGRDHVLAGAVVQRAWLTATHLEMAASLITQPLALPEGRAGLSEQLRLPGFPQVLMRFGRSVRVPERGPRRPYSDVVRDQR